MRRLPLLAAGGLAAWWLARRLRPGDDLAGSVALVTGGSRGLGFLLARELTRQGCHVVICARDEAELERAVDDLKESGHVAAVRCDVADRGEVARLVDEVTCWDW